jgi:hypothetical protein
MIKLTIILEHEAGVKTLMLYIRSKVSAIHEDPASDRLNVHSRISPFISVIFIYSFMNASRWSFTVHFTD